MIKCINIIEKFSVSQLAQSKQKVLALAVAVINLNKRLFDVGKNENSEIRTITKYNKGLS